MANFSPLASCSTRLALSSSACCNTICKERALSAFSSDLSGPDACVGQGAHEFQNRYCQRCARRPGSQQKLVTRERKKGGRRIKVIFYYILLYSTRDRCALLVPHLQQTSNMAFNRDPSRSDRYATRMRATYPRSGKCPGAGSGSSSGSYGHTQESYSDTPPHTRSRPPSRGQMDQVGQESEPVGQRA